MNDFAKMFPKTATPVKEPNVLTPIMNQAALGNLPVQVNSQPTTAMLVVTKPKLPVDLFKIGTANVDKVNAITENVLKRIKVADSGEFGKGVTEVLALTETVDMSKLDESNKGIFARAVDKIRQTRVKVLAQFDEVNQHVSRIAGNLSKEIDAMADEDKWMESMYNENLVSVRGLQEDINELVVHCAAQTQYVNDLKSVTNRTDQQEEELLKEHALQENIERHIHRLETQLQIAIMDAPDIRSLQQNNFNARQDFRDLIDVTIPSWKRQLTIALTAARQLRRAQLGNAIKDRNNELIRKRADSMHAASIQTTKLSQRSAVADADTLEYAQTRLVDRITQVRQIQADARVQREADIQRLHANRQKLKDEMAKW